MTVKGKKVLELYDLSLKLNGKYIRGVESRIAEMVGLSRERVRQILKNKGVFAFQLYEVAKSKCRGCGKEFRADKNRKYCSLKCRKTHHLKKWTVKEVCKFCKSEFSYYKPSHLIKRVYCSKRCQGLWIAKHFGWTKEKRK